MQITAGVNILILAYIIGCPLLLEVRGGESVDGTLIPGFTGVNVVIGVIEKLIASEVFYSSRWHQQNTNLVKSFLRQMAYAVSRDGRENTTGGIWDVSSTNFESTQDYVQNSPDIDLRQRIINSSLLGVDWISIEYDNLSVPIYSGLAVLLYLDEVLQTKSLSMQRLAQIRDDHFGINHQQWLDAYNYLTTYERM